MQSRVFIRRIRVFVVGSYDISLWKSLDLGGKTLKRGVAAHVLERGVYVLRLAKVEVLLQIDFYLISIIHCRFWLICE